MAKTIPISRKRNKKNHLIFLVFLAVCSPFRPLCCASAIATSHTHTHTDRRVFGRTSTLTQLYETHDAAQLTVPYFCSSFQKQSKNCRRLYAINCHISIRFKWSKRAKSYFSQFFCSSRFFCSRSVPSSPRRCCCLAHFPLRLLLFFKRPFEYSISFNNFCWCLAFFPFADLMLLCACSTRLSDSLLCFSLNLPLAPLSIGDE